MTPAQGGEDVEPRVVNPSGSPIPPADTSAGGHPKKIISYEKNLLFMDVLGLGLGLGFYFGYTVWYNS